jgi:hypothetical protein
MGIDAKGLAVWDTPPTPEIREAISRFATNYCKYPEPKWRTDTKMEIEFGADRLFAKHYARSQNALAQINYMRFLISVGAKVYYGGDCDEWVFRMMPEDLQSMEAGFHDCLLNGFSRVVPDDIWPDGETCESISRYDDEKEDK